MVFFSTVKTFHRSRARRDAAREEAEAAEKKREDEARDERERLEALNPGRWWSNPAGEAARAADDAPTAKAGGGVGKYISAAPKRRLPRELSWL